ncbi:MAG TPA: 16S rRNA (guanine(527)-N(7))-methyltransferase RsmG [Bacteroidales bacterium]|jgi:16S rRNA (guanine527-N7)-methyltransferase|nr:16S rRNA (guanine(527)-N(7))-methyltransferase RsmG [Bacteroidales bacterium]
MDIISKYFPGLTEKQNKQFQLLQSLYEEWNNKINVISRKDIDQLYERHILHSLAISKIIHFKPNTTILDVGTGGGFPGIPLAILFPECNFHLIDSIGKKIKVVQEISNSLGLTNLTSEQIRAEDIKNKYDFVVSRAVAAFPLFYDWVKTKLKKDSRNELKNGIIYLKGGDLDEELKDFKSKIKTFNISEFFTESFFETKKIIYLPI